MKMVTVSADRIMDALLANQRAVVVQRMGLSLCLGNAFVLLIDSAAVQAEVIEVTSVWLLLLIQGTLPFIFSAGALIASQHFINIARRAIEKAPVNKDPQP